MMEWHWLGRFLIAESLLQKSPNLGSLQIVSTPCLWGPQHPGVGSINRSVTFAKEPYFYRTLLQNRRTNRFHTCVWGPQHPGVGSLEVGSLNRWVTFAKEPYFYRTLLQNRRTKEPYFYRTLLQNRRTNRFKTMSVGTATSYRCNFWI